MLDPDALVIAVILLAVGPAVGSFALTVADRLAAGTSALSGRSACDHCGRPLGILDLVPILSWLLAGGRSRCCGQPLRTALLGAEIAGLLVALWVIVAMPSGLWLVSAGLGWTLLGLVLCDLACFRLPDPGTLGLLVAGLGLALAGGTGDPMIHVLGAVAGYAVLRGVALGYRQVRGIEGLGHGDAKLLGAAGAWLGLFAVPSVLLIGALAGLAQAGATALAGTRLGAQTAIPFGPGLAFGFWLVWLYGPLEFG
ncbi:MAG: A24 family peptidase [Pseudomonadota bacterium]